MRGPIGGERNGVLIAAEDGVALTYGLNNAQERGDTFIEAGVAVYEGMIVGLNSRDSDLTVNVCKAKKQTNIRAASSDMSVKLTPAIRLSLEQSLDFLAPDELLEVTPKALRLRKRLLKMHERARSKGKVLVGAEA